MDAGKAQAKKSARSVIQHRIEMHETKLTERRERLDRETRSHDAIVSELLDGIAHNEAEIASLRHALTMLQEA